MRKNLPTLHMFRAAAVFLSVAIASPAGAQLPGDVDLSFDPGSSIDGAVLACQQQSGGKWIIAGSFSTIHGAERGGIARLNPDGSLDASFLDGLAGANGQVNTVAVQNDDKVLIGGDFWSINGEERVRLARLHADGTLDHTFGEGLPGIVGHSLNLINFVHSIVLQSDGRILIGGSFTSVQGEPRNGIARLNADGTIDPTFSDGLAGVEAPHFPRVGTIVVQADGKILLGGSFTSVNGEPRHDIARLNPDGTLDLSFDVEVDGVHSISLQGDGKVLVGGSFVSVNGESRGRIARLNADGTLDAAFGNGLTGASHSVNSIAVQDDGRLLVGGSFTTINGETRNRIARLNADGSLDSSFGEGLAGPGNSPPSIGGISLQSDGKMVVRGHFTTMHGQPRNRIARLNTNGTLDEAFGQEFTGTGSILSLARGADGKIFIGGEFTTVAGEPRGRIASLNADATLDTAFAAGLAGANGSVEVIAVQDDGKVLLGGWFAEVHGETRQRLARLNPDGTLDEEFAPAFNGTVYAIAPQGDGKILVGGNFTVVNGTPRIRIARLNPDGSLDSTFGEGLAGPDLWVTSIAVQADENVLIGGYFRRVHDEPHYGVARLNADGTLDTEFTSGLPEATNMIKAIVLQPDGRSLIGGLLNSGGSGAMQTGIVRLNSDGTRDTTFANRLEGTTGGVSSIALQNDGAVLVGGGFTTVDGVIPNRIARFKSNGDVDPTFGNGLTGANGPVNTLLLQDEGKVAIGGEFSRVNGVGRDQIARLHGGSAPSTQTPSGILLGNDLVPEGLPAGTIVGDLTAVDENVTDTHTFTLVEGDGDNGNPLFSIEGNTLKTATVLDSSSQSLLTIRVRATDATALWVEEVLSLSVTTSPPGGLLHVDFSFDPDLSIDNWVNTIAQQTDGKVLVGGWFMKVNNETRRRIARLKADGTLDAGFAHGSYGADGPVYAIAVQDDGKILIGGRFRLLHGESRYSVARLHTDGTLDYTFFCRISGTSIVQTVGAIAVQSDGKILIGGDFSSVNGFARSGIARLHPDGTLDTTFGYQLQGTGGSNAVPHVSSIALQDGGKILIGGWFETVNGRSRNRIARLNTDGTVDETFGAAVAGTDGGITSVAVQFDGKILIAGTFTTVNETPRNRIARLHADGTLDETFGSGASGANSSVLSIAEQGDGRILIGGHFTKVNGQTRNRIARLHQDGTLDQALDGADESVTALTVERGGDILIGGFFTAVNGRPRNNLTRLHGGARSPDRAPTDILLSDHSVVEQRPVGTTIGLLSTVVPDGEEDHTFTLIAGDGDEGNSLFTIAEETLKTAAAFDYESQNSYSIRVKATARDGLFVEAILVIEIEPNQPPSEILLTNHQVAENRAIGTIVGSFSAVDPNADDVHTFTFVSGDGDDSNEFFAINDGVLSTATVLDYDEHSSHSIRVQATDLGGLAVVQILEILVQQDAYRAWAEVLPVDARGEEDDPGNHGISNLLRYAFDMDPLRPERDKLPRVGQVTQRAYSYLTITFTRRTDDSHLSYIVEGSPDFATWTEPGRGSRIDVVDDENGETETVTFTDNHAIDSRPKRFLRVRVER